MSNSNATATTGPCGACKFLRRKCVKGCIFAPYFDSDQGAAHFAAVHKVFGASNASKLLQGLPDHSRLDAVVTLCYEALARVRDPVYGCVAHIFALQQQVVNLQAELAYVQARLSILPRPSLPAPPSSLAPPSAPLQQAATRPVSGVSMDIPSPTDSKDSIQILQDTCVSSQLKRQVEMMPFFCDDVVIAPENLPNESSSLEDSKNGEFQSLAHEFISKYLPGMNFMPSSSQWA
ncbi:hypothetical protein Droror1_Dr00000419 [Drosera rotundifolia]